MDQILTKACSLVVEALSTDLASVMSLEHDGETLLMRAGVGWKPGTVGKTTISATANTSEAHALRTGEPMISPDVSTETRFSYPPFLTANGVRACANVVIIGGHGKPAFGILQVDSRVPRGFSEEDTTFLRGYANLLAAAVDRLRAIAGLRDREERLRLALEAGELGSWEFNLTLGTANCSLRYYQILGYGEPPPVWSHEAFLQRVVAEDLEQVSLALQRTLETGTDWSFQCRIQRADDHAVRWIAVTGKPAGELGGPTTRLIGIASDVTERLRTEERVRHSQRVEAVGRLTAGVAHDFNNVLQALNGNLELAMDGVFDRPDVRATLELALQAGRRGARLTSHLLSFSRQQYLHPMALDVSRLLADLLQTLKRTLGHRIAVHMEVDPDLPDVFVDPAHLDSALLNLSLNARDAMPDGGELRIQARATDERVVVAVADTGEGMTPDVLARACEPFFSTKGVNGSGLGLSMVQGFARQSGGELRIQSIPRQGTRVELWLPSTPRRVVMAEDLSSREARGQGSVLVVDDDEDVGRVAAAILRRAGFQVTLANGGDAALTVLGTDLPFDILVADFAMPGMNGAELVLRAQALRPSLVAIVTTGNSGAAGLEILPASVTILGKPFGRYELVDGVNTALQGATRER